MLELNCPSDSIWLEACMNNFEQFLLDHAASERKASATCMNFVVRFRDKPKLIDAMIRIAREELEHLHQVCKILAKLNIPLGGDEKDPYIHQMLQLASHAAESQLRDRLLLAGIIEMRGAERFAMISDGLKTHPVHSDLSEYYATLARDEVKHFNTYFHLAEIYYDSNEVNERLQFLLKEEARILKSLPPRPCLH